jgi:uncharacterized protein YdbL (DUF1318 family)
MHVKAKLAVLVGVAVVVVACITINVYFPEAAIKDLSEQIEEEVQQQAGEDAATAGDGEATPTPSPEARLQVDPLQWLLSLGASTAWAEEEEPDEVPAPEISNPAIRKLIDSRAARLKTLVSLKARGVIGENNRGMVEIRTLEPLESLKERAEVQRLVKAENADREQLYREIAAAENVDPSQLERIGQTYAETLRDKAHPGEWIQLPDGRWTQKQE